MAQSSLSQTSILEFWGKASAHDAGVSWHPLAYHLLDVAAVADAILTARPLTQKRAGWLLGLPIEDAHSLLISLAAIHDLGKFASSFQRLASPSGWKFPSALLADAGIHTERSVHTVDGLFLWQKSLRTTFASRIWPAGSGALIALECAVFGHHGRPVDSGLGPLGARFGSGAVEAASDCVQTILDLLLPVPIHAEPLSERRYNTASWWVAGFLTVADWIGSSQKWFPYTQPRDDDLELSKYWMIAKSRATVAVQAAGLAPARSAAPKSFSELTRKSSPTPIQLWAQAVLLPDDPLLIIIEDATGAGKTEAAQILVHRLLSDGRASGAYWAMPTQATANAMYVRQSEAIAALFSSENNALPSLTLGHGQAKLNDAYRRTVIREPDDAQEIREVHEPAEQDSASVACAAFLADDRRAALLADVGVGTVDQALLGVLPSKFAMVRLFALSEKVLILDEVHAFDAYMSTELKQLLRFHAALGGSAVLLSATLSEPKRRDLENVWESGVGLAMLPEIPAVVSPYPLATLISAQSSEREVYSPPPASVASRRTPVRLVHHEGEALQHLLDATAQGAAGVWIRNTVDECLRAAELIAQAGREPIVFHARFAQGDRQRIERGVMARFGVTSGTDERNGAILIATQVVEQSLDLDFDVMISDLAPIDLLIQRAGRLWRHSRGARSVVQPELLVLCPSLDEEPTSQWPDPLLRNTRHVYDNVGVLWRTATVLRDRPMIEAPSNIRSLIERVYERDDVPEAMLRADLTAQGKEYSAVAVADTHSLMLSEGYAAGTVWSDDLRVRTRLGEDQVPVRLARVQGNQIVPWIADALIPEWQRWSLSEVKLSAKRVTWDATCAPEWQSRINNLREAWSRFEQRTPVVVLDSVNDGIWTGTLRRSDTMITLEYSERLGASYA